MSKTITAKFDNIDSATIAASNTKDRCENVKGVKIKYKHEKKHNDNFYVGSNQYTSVSGSTPTVLQNGLFPLAFNVDPIGHHDYYEIQNRKATVEIMADDNTNYNKICSTLRQGGGTGIRIK